MADEFEVPYMNGEEDLDPDDLFTEHSESIDAYVAELDSEEFAELVQQADKRELYQSTCIEFAELVTITKEQFIDQGALLLVLRDGSQSWFPKKLCRNLDTMHKTVYVWNKFLQREHPKLLEEYGDV